MPSVGDHRFPASDSVEMPAVMCGYCCKIWFPNTGAEHLPYCCWTDGKRLPHYYHIQNFQVFQWNISDYFHQNQAKLSQTLSEDASVFPDFPGTLNMPNFDKLWMCFYVRLGELCVDPRPAVRKSAGQTLFSKISAHGGLLKQSTWKAVLWQVLFPLLDKVRALSNSASSEKVDTGGKILIHHSRNTAQKQWAETQVLTLSGVARVFSSKRQLLQALGDFFHSWSLLLEFIENAALSKNNEVSLAALKSFQEILYSPAVNEDDDGESWAAVWRVWLKIGMEITYTPSDTESDECYLPSQAFLTALVQIFPMIFQHMKDSFSLKDLKQLCIVLTNAVTVPLHGETAPYVMATATSDYSLTPLHHGCLYTMEILQKEATSRNNNKMLPEIFKELLVFAKFTCSPPNCNVKHSKASEWITMNYIPFGEKALTMAVKLYEKTAENPEVITAGVLHNIVATLHLPLALKYSCISSSTWKLAANSLISVLQIGLPVARCNANQFATLWDELVATFNEFLFPKT